MIEWRGEPRDIPLDMEQLSHLGLVVVYEARTKHLVALAVKVASGLSYEQWKAIQDSSLDRLTGKLRKAVRKLDNADITLVSDQIFNEYRAAKEIRDRLVHAIWAFGQNSAPVGRAYRHNQQLTGSDLTEAVGALNSLSSKAHYCCMLLAKLVAKGQLQIYPEKSMFHIGIGDQWVDL